MELATELNNPGPPSGLNSASAVSRTFCQINPAGGLNKAEIDRLVQEAEEHSQLDRERRETRRVQNRLEGMLLTNERVFEQFGEMLSDSERRRVRALLLKTRASLSSGDRNVMEALLFDLNTLSKQLSDLMLERIED